MSRFITKIKEIIAIKEKITKDIQEIPNKKVETFFSSLLKSHSNDKIDEFDIEKQELFQINHILVSHVFLSESYDEDEEIYKDKFLNNLKNKNYKISINNIGNNIRSGEGYKNLFSLRKNIISIIKTKPNINIINENGKSDEYNDIFFVNLVSQAKVLVENFLKKYKITKILELEASYFDDIILNYQSFNDKAIFALNNYLEKFDNFYQIYNNFFTIFKQIEKINNILLDKKMNDQILQNCIEKVYSGFENGVNSLSLSYNSKFTKLNDSIKKLENDNKEINNIVKKIQEDNKKLQEDNKILKEENLKIVDSLKQQEKRIIILEGELEKLKQCPIACQTINNPSITPSGKTIEENAKKESKNKDGKEPLTKNPLNENQ